MYADTYAFFVTAAIIQLVRRVDLFSEAQEPVELYFAPTQLYSYIAVQRKETLLEKKRCATEMFSSFFDTRVFVGVREKWFELC